MYSRKRRREEYTYTDCEQLYLELFGDTISFVTLGDAIEKILSSKEKEFQKIKGKASLFLMSSSKGLCDEYIYKIMDTIATRIRSIEQSIHQLQVGSKVVVFEYEPSDQQMQTIVHYLSQNKTTSLTFQNGMSTSSIKILAEALQNNTSLVSLTNNKTDAGKNMIFVDAMEDNHTLLYYQPYDIHMEELLQINRMKLSDEQKREQKHEIRYPALDKIKLKGNAQHVLDHILRRSDVTEIKLQNIQTTDGKPGGDVFLQKMIKELVNNRIHYRLHRVSVQNSNIQESGLLEIADISKLSQTYILMLDIRRNPDITRKAVEALLHMVHHYPLLSLQMDPHVYPPGVKEQFDQEFTEQGRIEAARRYAISINDQDVESIIEKVIEFRNQFIFQ